MGWVFCQESYERETAALGSMELKELLELLDGTMPGEGATDADEEDDDGLQLDWEEIARRCQSQRLGRSAEDCRTHWCGVADPRINNGKWSEAERTNLEALASQWQHHQWEQVRRGPCRCCPLAAVLGAEGGCVACAGGAADEEWSDGIRLLP